MLKTLLNSQKVLTPKDVALCIAERLKITRRSNHIRLQDLAQKLGVSRKQLQNYESGKSNLTIVRLWEIASFLNVDITFFVEGLSKNKVSVPNEDLHFLYKLHNLHNKKAKESLINLLNDL